MAGKLRVVTITETWWDDSHDRSAAVDGYKQFRRDKKLRKGSGMALYIKERFNVELGVGNDKLESL